jgi:4-alpha-glucanotransferase
VTEESSAAALVRFELSSIAELALLPVQDILGLGTEARMNTPSTTVNNWSWRLFPGELTADHMSECSTC